MRKSLKQRTVRATPAKRTGALFSGRSRWSITRRPSLFASASAGVLMASKRSRNAVSTEDTAVPYATGGT